MSATVSPPFVSGGQFVQLIATPNGGTSPYSFRWTQTSGSPVVLNTPNSQTATLTPSLTGPYTFRVTVTDSTGATASASVTLTVT